MSDVGLEVLAALRTKFRGVAAGRAVRQGAVAQRAEDSAELGARALRARGDLERHVLEQLHAQPSIVADVAAAVGLPVAAMEAYLWGLERRGLVHRRLCGTPPVMSWEVPHE